MRRFALPTLAACALAVTALATALASCLGCSRHGVVDMMAYSAHRPDPVAQREPVPGGGAALTGEGWQLLAGDMHCHVSPPDDSTDVSRGLEETLRLAREERLDFVMLTPHVWSRFFQYPELRGAVLDGHRRLRQSLERLARGAAPVPIFVAGFEYTDHEWGHVGAGFGDLEATLAEVSVEEARRAPERFFERYVERGGLLVINHPLITPLDSIFSVARANLSWRPFTSEGPFPAEIEGVDRLAQGVEAYNLAATHLRDRYLLGDTEHSLRATLSLLDREGSRRRRRMTPVGGSDSHSHHLRATTFVLARARTEAAVREAVIAGRTCIRDPAACSLRARAPGGTWEAVGGAIEDVSSIEVRADGDDIELWVGGVRTAAPEAGEIVRAPVRRGLCTPVRARVGAGFSAPIYVNCHLEPGS